MFADVAVIGPLSSINLSAIGWSGILMPRLSEPAVSSLGRIAFFFKMSVRGPGKNISASFLA